MATRWPGATDATDASDERSLADVRSLRIDATTGFLLLAVTKAMDAATTAFALAYVPWIEEANPLVAAVFADLGAIPGIVALSVVGVLGLTVITELVAGVVDDAGDGPQLVRLIGYVPTSILFALLGVQNAVLILTGVSVFAAF